MNAQEIIQKSKDLFPCGYHFTGMLTDTIFEAGYHAGMKRGNK